MFQGTTPLAEKHYNYAGHWRRRGTQTSRRNVRFWPKADYHFGDFPAI
jgi:hypothetical protein